MSSSISQVWNAKLLFTRLFSPLPPQTRQFGKCDFSSPRAVRAAGTVVAPNLWMWHIDWEIYSLQTTLVFPVDSPQVSALSSYRSHSSSRTMCENIWEEKKKIVFEKCVFLRVRRCFYLIFLWASTSVVVFCGTWYACAGVKTNKRIRSSYGRLLGKIFVFMCVTWDSIYTHWLTSAAMCVHVCECAR